MTPTDPYYLVNRQARAQWDKPKAPPPPHPKPEVVNQPATDDQIPARARTLIRAAERAGFTIEVVFGRGTPLNKDEVVDSISVRCRRGPEWISAVWVGGKYTSGWAWSDGQFPAPRTLTKLNATIGRVS